MIPAVPNYGWFWVLARRPLDPVRRGADRVVPVCA